MPSSAWQKSFPSCFRRRFAEVRFPLPQGEGEGEGGARRSRIEHTLTPALSLQGEGENGSLPRVSRAENSGETSAIGYYSFPNSVVDYISLIAFCSGYPVTHLISDPYSDVLLLRRFQREPTGAVLLQPP